eukprot:TRINITY_DN61136_c0_g1_i1.p1 TRINITY_DN61136_c0_g1~~TRINITY_DN61136_c0_g1_i1.p1  ORF type:complete len:552 (-),score=111.98 TRINITY_DN61136_c0_g1_i1:31-1620(-)
MDGEPPQQRRRVDSESSPATQAAAECPVAGAGGNGIATGALVCEVKAVGKVFDALRAAGGGLARQHGVRHYVESEGEETRKRSAVHLTPEGSALLLAGGPNLPPPLRTLLDDGVAIFVPGLRLGAEVRPPRQRGGTLPVTAVASSSMPPEVSDGSAAFTFVDLFAGIGGFRWALKGLGGRCMLSSEIDVECQAVLGLNFGWAGLMGDITCIPSEAFPASPDLITAGFCCQPFTRRGELRALEDPRGQLFFEIVRVLSASKPKAFFLENVDHIEFADGGKWAESEEDRVQGKAFTEMMKALEEVGYSVRYQEIDASDWVPQKRRRLYIIGVRADLSDQTLARFHWPERPQRGGGKLRDILEPLDAEEVRACELTEEQWAAVQRSSPWLRGGAALRFARLDGQARTLVGCYRASFKNTSELISSEDSGLARPRFFTRRECARLMGFPEEHNFGNENSPNRAYRQFGNAVCVPLVRAVAANLLRALGLLPSKEDGQRGDESACVHNEPHDSDVRNPEAPLEDHLEGQRNPNS